MSTWGDLLAGLNSTCARAFPIPATLLPQTGTGPVEFSGIIERPAFGEDSLPGTLSGANIMLLWVDFQALSTQPLRGDIIIVDGISYDLFDIAGEHDPQGGATLKLRKNRDNA